MLISVNVVVTNFSVSFILKGDIQSIREAYNAFLEEYPLCYMYWKKLADHEQTRGDPEVVRKVYERGVAAIPYSVDLWVHYCTYLLEKNADVNDSRRCAPFHSFRSFGSCSFIRSQLHLPFPPPPSSFSIIPPIFKFVPSAWVTRIRWWVDKFLSFFAPFPNFNFSEERNSGLDHDPKKGICFFLLSLQHLAVFFHSCFPFAERTMSILKPTVQMLNCFCSAY